MREISWRPGRRDTYVYTKTGREIRESDRKLMDTGSLIVMRSIYLSERLVEASTSVPTGERRRGEHTERSQASGILFVLSRFFFSWSYI
jgi:hypothetical protein